MRAAVLAQVRGAVDGDGVVRLLLLDGAGKVALDVGGRGAGGGVLAQHGAHHFQHWREGGEDGVCLLLLRVVVEQCDPGCDLGEVAVEVEGAICDAAAAAGGAILGSAVVDEGGDAALAEVGGDIEEDGAEGEDVGCFGVGLVRVPGVDDGCVGVGAGQADWVGAAC